MEQLTLYDKMHLDNWQIYTDQRNQSLVAPIIIYDDHIYISELSTNREAGPGDATYNGINVSNRGYFGWGRTWNISLRYKF